MKLQDIFRRRAGRKTILWMLQAGVASLAAASLAAAQSAATPPSALRLPQVIDLALHHYPAVVVAEGKVRQDEAAVGLARSSYLPDLRLVSQTDRATDNNTPGLLISNGLPTISGPVAAQYTWQGVWTSSAGVVMSWEFADFGRRRAGVDFYRSLARQSREQLRQTQLEVGAHAADTFLATLAAEQGVRVAEADVARWTTVSGIVHVLVDQQLRPGADASRVDAELAAARLSLARSQDALARSQAALAEAIGVPLADLGIEGGDLLARAPQLPGVAGPPDLKAAPLLRAQQAGILAAQLRQRQLQRSDLPRFYLLASAYGRGTELPAGSRDVAVANGLAPLSAGNWVVGLGIEYSFTRHWQNQNEKAIARQQTLREQARETQLTGALQLAWRQASADLNAARQALVDSPVELQAAQTGEAQARARYRAGLAGIVELANAEELLVKAQTDDLITHLQIWRALLKLSYAEGDLAPFIQQIGGPAAGGQ